MANVLTMASTIQCGPTSEEPLTPLHGGTVAKLSAAKLKVNGQSVLVKRSIGPLITGCKTPPTSSTSPCTAVSTVLLGEATKLKVNNTQAVMLETLTGTTNQGGDLSAEANQTKLTAI
jgi:hypothetical protein